MTMYKVHMYKVHMNNLEECFIMILQILFYFTNILKLTVSGIY